MNCEDFTLAGGYGNYFQAGVCLGLSSPVLSGGCFPAAGSFLSHTAHRHSAENSGTFFSRILPCELRPSWPGRPPTLSPQLRDLQSPHRFALFVPWPGNSLGCELRQKLHLVSHLSGLTVPCCLMSNVLKVLVLFLQSAFLVASGGRVHLVPVTLS